jgi:hypothetical protein
MPVSTSATQPDEMPAKLLRAIFASAFFLSCGGARAEALSVEPLFIGASPLAIKLEAENSGGKSPGESGCAEKKKKPNPTRAAVAQSTAAISPTSSCGALFDESGWPLGIPTSYLKDSRTLGVTTPPELLFELPARQPTAKRAPAVALGASREALKPIFFIWALLLGWR